MVEIQSGTPADVEAAAAFLRANGLSSEALPGGNAEAPGTLFTVASCHGRVVGSRVAVRHERRGPRNQRRRSGGFHVNTVIVDPGFRGAGVGQGLVKRLLGDAFGRGFRTAQLWVHTDNAAALFLYGKFGFAATGGSVDDERLGSIQQLAADLKPAS